MTVAMQWATSVGSKAITSQQHNKSNAIAIFRICKALKFTWWRIQINYSAKDMAISMHRLKYSRSFHQQLPDTYPLKGKNMRIASLLSGGMICSRRVI